MRPPYQDRRHAGRILADELARHGYGKRDPGGAPLLVLALPRGGVPVGYEVAAGLRAPLDVFVVRKLGVPSHPELAMGALGSGGVRVLNEPVVRKLRIAPEVVEQVTEAEMEELVKKEKQIRGDLAVLEPAGTRVLLVDDGLATGASMRAAVEAVRKRSPAGITVAVPTAPSETARGLREVADEVICAIETENFVAVGQWYGDFSQTEDDEVRRLLVEARRGEGDRLLS